MKLPGSVDEKERIDGYKRPEILYDYLFPSLTISVEQNVPIPPTDDGTGPEKMALIMGPPDRCQHAASIITDLLQSVRAREEGGQVSTSWSSLL